MPFIRTVLGLTLGLFIGVVVNGSMVQLGTVLFPFPPEVNFDTSSGMQAFHDLPVHFYIFPFLAHAIGTLSGCITAIIILRNQGKWVVYSIGYLFFVAGIIAVDLINAPVWFDILDLSLAYLPMAWLSMQSRIAKKS